MSKIGITGSRYGCSPVQMLTGLEYILSFNVEELHHGDCYGVDTQMARLFGRNSGTRIHCHPPDNDDHRSFVGEKQGDVMYREKGYLERDRDIVDACDILVGFPNTKEPRNRSGTWYTLRYAVREGVPARIVFPDGTIEVAEKIL